MRDKRRNTELRAEAGLQRVEMMLLRRRLQWLGHVARMDSTRIFKCVLVCKPDRGKHNPGGQKRRWADVVVGDLKRCECLQDWRQQVQDRRQWRGMVKVAAEGINEQMEEEERARKDERKRRREEVDAVPIASEIWACSEPGCVFFSSVKGRASEPYLKKAHYRFPTAVEVPTLREVVQGARYYHASKILHKQPGKNKAVTKNPSVCIPSFIILSMACTAQ